MKYKVKRTKFTTKRDGLKIVGYEFRPVGVEGKLPIAIVSHEFMMNQISTVHKAKILAEMGYCAYSYDFNGGGTISASEGKTTEMTVFTEVADLKAVVEYVKALDYTDNDNLNLVGCSQGGFASAIAAAELGDEVKKLCLFYPALSIPDDARKGSMIMAKFDPQNPPKKLFCGPIILGRDYPTCVLDVDPMALISKYTGKVLIMHGTTDHIVDCKYSVMAEEAYKAAGADVELMLVNGGGHMFPVPVHYAKANKKMKEFLAL